MKAELLACLVAVTTLSHSARAQEHDTVWVWNAQCPSPVNVAIRVRLDRRTVYRNSIQVCRWERRFEKGKASFSFTPGRPVVWYGYRSDEGDGSKDPGDTTAARTQLEIDFWQAGGEPDAIELGYSATAPDGIHMNSLHFLSPTRRVTTTMAPGLVLDTWPQTKR